MAGKIVLVGGDEFRQGCEPMDEELLKATGVERPKVLIVPTAAATENAPRAASNGVNYFQKLGAEASSLMVVDSQSANDEKLLAPADSADMIYFTGGNPANLLDAVTDSLLLTRMREAIERGAIVGGSSAGAMVMGSWMRFREWRQALGIVLGVVTLPHHERADADNTAREIANAAPSEVTALGIDGKTGCLLDSGQWSVLGTGNVTVYQSGGWERYTVGDGFSL